MKHGKSPAVKEYDIPYMDVQDPARMGKGMVRSTTFGVLGRTKADMPTRSLGGLVERPVHHKVPKGEVDRHPKLIHTERHITGPAAKTHVSGMHFGQVPYPGRYMAPLGAEL